MVTAVYNATIHSKKQYRIKIRDRAYISQNNRLIQLLYSIYFFLEICNFLALRSSREYQRLNVFKKPCRCLGDLSVLYIKYLASNKSIASKTLIIA